MTEKIIRTPKEWIETCRQCGGVGHKMKREFFALYTPDEYAAALPEYASSCTVAALYGKRGSSAVPNDAYVCRAAPGASIGDACKEGIGLAKIVGLPVAFEFNDAVVVCRADSDPDVVMREWWKRAYGETYEQSWARR